MALRTGLLLPLIFLISSAGLKLKGQATQTVNLPGLKQNVEIIRDSWGVNHIYANNQHDLFFAQGYAAAKDRLFQFEVWRRQATGTVAEILGERELTRDIGTRLFKFRSNLNEELSHYHKDGIEIITAFTNGINAYIDEILKTPELLPEEFGLLGLTPGKWNPEDVISRHNGLLGNITEELNMGIAVHLAGEEKVKEISLFIPGNPNISIDKKINASLLKPEILDIYRASHRSVRFNRSDIVQKDEPRGTQGSNNWILSGEKTTTGLPYMANDPHRLVSLPALRYMVHLVAPGWNVIGGGEPVIPGVSIGHNEYGAWGLTIHETDFEDLYVYDLHPQNTDEYFHKGKWVKMQSIQETISVKGKPDTTVNLYYTVHGPVTYIDTANRVGYSIKCAWMEIGGAPYLAALRFNQAKNWKQFRKAANYNHVPAENMIWADKKGNIGWQVVGISPVRKNFSGLVPIPGDGSHEWSGYLKIKKRPHLYNPKKNFLATANEYVIPEGFKHWNASGFLWADPYRGQRINEVLSENKKFSMQDMKNLQADYYSIPGRDLAALFKNISFDDALTQRAADSIKNWNYIMGVNSIGGGIYAMWERKINLVGDSIILGDLKPYLDVQLKKIISFLQTPGENSFFKTGEDRDSFLKYSFELAINDLKAKLGDDINKWQYGQPAYKHISLSNAVLRLAGITSTLGPVARGGNGHTPAATSGYDNQLYGASFKFIADLSDWDNSLMINAPGQSADRRSPYYSNLFDIWANDEFFPAVYTREKVEAAAEERIELRVDIRD